MPKYEIMLILDPKADEAIVANLAKESFKGGKPNVKKLDRTTLAYEINKSMTAKYFLIDVETDGADVKEFSRKANIEKSIWRYMAVNMDTEKTNKKPRKKTRREAEATPAEATKADPIKE